MKARSNFGTTLESRPTADKNSKIRRIHCEIADGPKFFAQVIFQSEEPGWTAALSASDRESMQPIDQ